MKKSISFSSEYENLDLVEKFVTNICEYEDINEKYFGNILIAVSEGANNAMCHGNKQDPGKKVKIDYYVNGNELGFVVTDEGSGFDFESIPDPTLPENLEKLSGRGLFLIKSLADDVEYKNNGNTLEMKFHLDEVAE